MIPRPPLRTAAWMTMVAIRIAGIVTPARERRTAGENAGVVRWRGTRQGLQARFLAVPKLPGRREHAPQPGPSRCLVHRVRSPLREAPRTARRRAPLHVHT